MKVLGITGRTQDAAAALAVDGCIVAAATEDSFARVQGVGYEQTGGFPYAAVKACLTVAGLEMADLTEVVIVDDDENGSVDAHSRRPSAPRTDLPALVRSIDASDADAIQAAITSPDATSVLVCGTNPPALAVFKRDGTRLGARVDIPGAAGLADAARTLASALGLRTRDPLAALDRLSVGAEPEFAAEMSSLLRWAGHESGVAVLPETLPGLIRRIAGDQATGLMDAHSLNTRIQHTRHALAASFMDGAAKVVARLAESTGGAGASSSVGMGGGMFANARFNTELTKQTSQGLSFAPVPEAFGRALGAVAMKPAIGGAGAIASAGLAIGPAFSEEEIKRTLDNCRLDYVYEPDWTRLLTRISGMLAQGKVVGWFQGAMAFGPRAMGTRSILGDPSHKYARQNLNEYLRQLPLDEPLPVAVAPSLANQFFLEQSPAPSVVDAEVRPEWRQALAAALDWRHSVRVHGVSQVQAPRLGELLELHYAATGTPGLIETNLAGPGEPVACTPRDAVRTVYSSAVDVLVMGRFLLMKDYWLLRTQDK